MTLSFINKLHDREVTRIRTSEHDEAVRLLVADGFSEKNAELYYEHLRSFEQGFRSFPEPAPLKLKPLPEEIEREELKRIKKLKAEWGGL